MEDMLMQAIELVAWIREACQVALSLSDEAEQADTTLFNIAEQADAFLTTPDVQAFVTRQVEHS